MSKFPAPLNESQRIEQINIPPHLVFSGMYRLNCFHISRNCLVFTLRHAVYTFAWHKGDVGTL